MGVMFMFRSMGLGDVKGIEWHSLLPPHRGGHKGVQMQAVSVLVRGLGEHFLDVAHPLLGDLHGAREQVAVLPEPGKGVFEGLPSLLASPKDLHLQGLAINGLLGPAERHEKLELEAKLLELPPIFEKRGDDFLPPGVKPETALAGISWVNAVQEEQLRLGGLHFRDPSNRVAEVVRLFRVEARPIGFIPGDPPKLEDEPGCAFVGATAAHHGGMEPLVNGAAVLADLPLFPEVVGENDGDAVLPREGTGHRPKHSR